MRIRLSLLLPLAITAAAFTQPPQRSWLPENPLQGRTLFESRRCETCHSMGAEGASIGPMLGEGGFKGTLLDLGAQLWNHVPGMSVTFERAGYDWPVLNEDEAASLLSFLYFAEYLGRPGRPEDGRRVFQDRGCTSCHRIGTGGNSIGPDLARLQHFASPIYVAQEIWNHGPQMLATIQERGMQIPTFREGDLADLSAFIRQQAGPDPVAPLLAAPGSPRKGSALFSTFKCASCHGTSGRGGNEGPDLLTFDLQVPAETLAGLMWNHAIGMRDAMAARGIGWPVFRDSDLADLTAFLYFLPFQDPAGDAGRGRRVFSDRSCAICHPGDGAGMGAGDAVGPDLGNSTAALSPAALIAAMWSHAPVMKESILHRGRAWPELSGGDLRDLMAYLKGRAGGR